MQTDLSCGDGFTLAHHRKQCSPILSLHWMTALHLKGRFHIPITAPFFTCKNNSVTLHNSPERWILKQGWVFFSCSGTSTLFKTQKLLIIQDLLFFRNQTSATGTVIRQVQVVALVNLQLKRAPIPSVIYCFHLGRAAGLNWSESSQLVEL